MNALAVDLQRRAAAAAEVLARRRALETMEGFRQYMAATGSNDFAYPPAEHHKLLQRELEQLIYGDTEGLTLALPPGAGKSVYGSVQFPLWALAKFPHWNILAVSNTQNLAEGFNRRRRNLALTPEWMRLSGTHLSKDAQGVEHFATEREGGIRAAGIGASITGFRAHLGIIDDPIIGMEQAMSNSQLDAMADWYSSEFLTRLVPGARVVIISTRWSPKDLIGRILAEDDAA